MKKCLSLLFCLLLLPAGCGANENRTDGGTQAMEQYTFPAEDGIHEGTWLTWPHHYTYGVEYREEVEEIWVQMADSLHTGENVHIVAYDESEKQRITALLQENGLDMSKIDFVIAPSDDVWTRDTGPMFVRDGSGKLVIADFGFDGWGEKTPYENDDDIPKAAAEAKGIPLVDISDFVLEGGSVELDGSGTAMLCKSSVISKNRNPSLSAADAEKVLSQYLGVSHFIWLEGVTDEDITDAHIDGMARFYDDKTILTVSEDDFFELYKGIQEKDYLALTTAKNAKGEPCEIIEMPMTAKNVEGLDYKGSYLNYYIGNEVVLLPVYNDENDDLAVEILSELYEEKEIVPIDVTALYQYGGMLHCVTQQQPRE